MAGDDDETKRPAMSEGEVLDLIASRPGPEKVLLRRRRGVLLAEDQAVYEAQRTRARAGAVKFVFESIDDCD